MGVDAMHQNRLDRPLCGQRILSEARRCQNATPADSFRHVGLVEHLVPLWRGEVESCEFSAGDLSELVSELVHDLPAAAVRRLPVFFG